MTVARFEGTGPVARYWLAKCEGFAVTGGARGVVEELIRDNDPHVTTRLVVRTRGRRRRIVPAGAVATVVPAERTLVVARPRKPPRVRRAVQLPSVSPVATRAASAASRLGPPARSAAAHAAALGPPARGAALVLGRVAARNGRRAGAVLAVSLRLLATEALATAALVVRSVRREASARLRRPAADRRRASRRNVRDRSSHSTRAERPSRRR